MSSAKSELKNFMQDSGQQYVGMGGQLPFTMSRLNLNLKILGDILASNTGGSIICNCIILCFTADAKKLQMIYKIDSTSGAKYVTDWSVWISFPRKTSPRVDHIGKECRVAFLYNL